MHEMFLRNDRDDLALDTVGIVATTLAEKFGESALHVAEQQIEAAEPDSRDKWTEIVNHLARNDC